MGEWVGGWVGGRRRAGKKAGVKKQLNACALIAAPCHHAYAAAFFSSLWSPLRLHPMFVEIAQTVALCFNKCRQNLNCRSVLYDSTSPAYRNGQCYLYSERKQMTPHPNSWRYSCMTKQGKQAAKKLHPVIAPKVPTPVPKSTATRAPTPRTQAPTPTAQAPLLPTRAPTLLIRAPTPPMRDLTPPTRVYALLTYAPTTPNGEASVQPLKHKVPRDKFHWNSNELLQDCSCTDCRSVIAMHHLLWPPSCTQLLACTHVSA